MKIFTKEWWNWVSSIDPKFNPKLLQVPTPDFIEIFKQPERLNPETPKGDAIV